MLIQGQVGAIPTSKQTGGNPNIVQGFLAELLVSELSPQFYTLLKNNLVFFSALSAANATAFTGGAAGTPLIGIMNPSTSGKDVIVLQTRIGLRTDGTLAGSLDFNWYGGASALPTAAVTVPRNAYSLAQSGSIALAFQNTAMTSSTAINAIAAATSIGAVPGTTGTLSVFQAADPVSGLIVAAPGNLIALGASASTTAASIDATVFWAELPA